VSSNDDDDSSIFDIEELFRATEAADEFQIELQVRLMKSLDIPVDFEHIGKCIVKNHVNAIMKVYGARERDDFLKGIRGSTSN
jgi:hypothetical protein